VGAQAQPADVQARFAEANAAFATADFPRALQLYEQCLALGMSGPAVHFNIGVAAYRSGEYARAERAFREVAATPAMAALAHYNLGLVELKRGHPGKAREWFELAAHGGGDERLRSLALRRLAELQPESKPRAGSLYARLGLGYDGNVALRSDSLDTPGSGQSDQFGEAFVAGSYSFLPAWRVDAAAGAQRYASLDEFDQTALSLGIAHSLALESWYFELGATGTQLTLGGDVYERSVTAAAQVTRAFSHQQSVHAQLRAASVDGEDEFSGISGNRTGAALDYQWGWSSWNFGAHASAERNHTQVDYFAQDWTEWGMDARWAFSPLWNFTAGGTWRRTRHPAESDEQQAWTDRRTALRLEATRTLWKQAQLFVRYEHERNRSPVEVNDYDRDWLAVSIEFWR
jgi:tetratricopeptide (TPR) repeat protein